jgi:hypothetical protein
VLRDVCGDARIPARLAEREEPHSGEHDHARRAVERHALDPPSLDVAIEVLAVGAPVDLDLLAQHGEQRGVVCVGRIRNEEVRALGPDHVVGRDRRRGGECAGEVGGREVQDLVGAPVLEDPAPPRPVGISGRLGERAAHHRRDLGRRAHGDHRPRVERPASLHLLLDELLRAVDERDVPLVARARIFAEGDQTVLREDQPLDLGRAFVGLGGEAGEREAGHCVGDPGDATFEHRAHALFAIRLIRQRQDAVGVRVVDEPVRQEGVHQHLDRRSPALRGREQGAAQLRRHGLVVEGVERTESQQVRQAQGGQALGIDRCQIAAAPLYAEHVDLLAEQVPGARFHRGVPAAVEHEVGLFADQARGVDA